MNTLESLPTPTQAKPERSLSVAHNPPASSARPLWRIGTIALVIVIVAGVAGLIPRWRQRAVLRADTRELAIPTVAVVSPLPGKGAALPPLPAEIRPQIEASVYARTSGYLRRWLVDIGAHVKEGDLLAEIDTPELNQELARARAELSQAEAALALAKTTAARWEELLKTASVSEQETAEKQADLALKLATVDASRANVRRLEELQSFERVVAPFTGTITDRTTDLGDLISNTKQLFRLAQTDMLRVYARVPQALARQVLPGQSAELTLPEMPGRTYVAKVVRTAGAMDAQSRTLLTELAVDNSKGEIVAGGFAEVRFTDARPDAPLTLPANTLLFRAEGPQVGVVLPNGKVELKSITLGRDLGAALEILSGVSPSDRVIINPADSLVSGVMVRLPDGPATLAQK